MKEIIKALFLPLALLIFFTRCEKEKFIVKSGTPTKEQYEVELRLDVLGDLIGQ